MTDTASTTHGPGPIIHGPDRNHPGLFIIQLADGTIGTATQTDITQIPIPGQWFTGTRNGLIASWPNRAIAEEQATQRGTLLGQIAPVPVSEIRRFLDDHDGDGNTKLIDLIAAARAVNLVAGPTQRKELAEALADYETATPTADEVKFVMLLNPTGQPLHGQ